MSFIIEKQKYEGWERTEYECTDSGEMNGVGMGENEGVMNKGEDEINEKIGLILNTDSDDDTNEGENTPNFNKIKLPLKTEINQNRF